MWLCCFAPAWTAEPQKLRGHVPAAAARLTPLGKLDATAQLNLAIALPLRNQAALTKLLQDISDPASPNYRKYLTPEQFTAQFGPTDADYQAVVKFAKAHGLTVTAAHPNRVLLDVKGASADIEKAFHVTMQTYRHPTEGRQFFAPSGEPSLDLTVPIAHISGLDDYARPHPRFRQRAVAPRAANAAPNAGSGPSGGYRGNDFRAAYVPGTSLTGAGQTVGLLQFDGYAASDITYYETQAGLPNVTLTNVLLDGFNGTPTGNGGEVEVSLDIEMAISMAPGLSKVIVYEAGPSGLWHDLLNRMATDNLAKQLSCSWFIPGGAADTVADGIFQQMAAQGQSFYSASGDYDASTGLISFPGDSPYITQVGGTTLATTGSAGPWSSEQVWNWGNGVGSAGGVSTQYSLPTWQQGISMAANQGSTTMRNVPDVAIAADNIYVRADGVDHSIGGTSCAAPLWAGFTALINQQAVAHGHATMGFINPAIYTIGKGTNYATAFHDTTVGNNFSINSPTKFAAASGYDLCTGWGTPNGASLINALAGPSDPLQVTALPFASTGQVGGPFSVTSQTYTVTNTGAITTATFSKTQAWTSLSSSGGTFGPAYVGSLTWSLNSNANALPAGTYTDLLTVKNTVTGVSQVLGMTLTIVPVVNHFTFSAIASPQAIGTPIPVTVTAMDGSNTPITAYTGTVAFTASNGMAVSPSTSGNFVNGQWTGTITLSGTATSTVVTAKNSVGASGQSSSFGLTVPVVSTLTLASNDLIYDPGTQKIYVSVPSSDNSGRANTVTPLDPATRTFGTPIPAGTNPSKLAVSDDGQFLYAAQLGAREIGRITLASQALGLQFGLGNFDAEDIQVFPGSAHSIAISLLSSAGYNFGVAVYDDAVQRPNAVQGSFLASSIAFGSTANTLYGVDGSGELRFSSFAITASGLSLGSQLQWSNGGGGATIKAAQGLLYSSDGEVVDPVASERVATLPASGLVLPDLANGRIYSLADADQTDYVLHVYSATTYAELGSYNISGVSGSPGSLIHWPGGVAFRTTGNQIFVLNVDLAASPANTADLSVTQVAAPAPAVLGQPLTLTFHITNNGPIAAANAVLNETLPSGVTYVSSSASQGTVAVSGGAVTANLGTLASGASATVAVTVTPTVAGTISSVGTVASSTTDPIGSNNSTLQTVSVISAPAGATQVSIIPLSASDLAYDSMRGVLYAGIPAASGALANNLALINPATSGVSGFQFIGSDPSRLVCSGDYQYLYVAAKGASTVNRFNLATQAVDLQVNLGVKINWGFLSAQDIAVLPQLAHSFAVARAISNYNFGLAVYDDSTERPTDVTAMDAATTITFSSSATTLYTYEGADTGFNFNRYSVYNSGLSLIDSTPSLVSGFGTTLRADGSLIYASNGQVINPQTDSLVTTVPGPGSGSLVCPDSARNRIYYLTQTDSTATLLAFDETTYAATGTATVSGLAGTATSLVRCGGHRLAFATTEGQIFIVSDDKLVPSILTMALPAKTVEGAGTLTAAGTVSVSEPPATDLVVSLASSNTGKITVPATVTIPARQLSASFNVTVVDNAVLDGPQKVTVSASATAFPTASASIQVNDNELASFTVTLPANVTQGTTAQGTVRISAAPAANIVVALSSNSSAISVPATVTILAGQTSATFTVTVPDAGQIVGTQSAAITAHVDNWTDGTANVSIADDLNPAEWPTLGNGAGHTGYQAATLGATPFMPGWFTTEALSGSGLNQVAVGSGFVFVTPNATFTNSFIGALDAQTGVSIWQYNFSKATLDPPTCAAGTLYVRRGPSSSPGTDAALLALNPANGSLLWTAPYVSQGTMQSLAPTVANGEAWIEAGYFGGMNGYNTADGSARFANTSLEFFTYWTPTYYSGLLYTWMAGNFRAHDPQTGVVQWQTTVQSGQGGNGTMYTVPAIAQGRAFLVGNGKFYAVDLTQQTALWSTSGTFTGTPAVANGIAYVLTASQVNAYNTTTGALVGTYATTDTALAGQPLVTNDTVIVASPSAVYIFDLASFSLRQTLRLGAASLANVSLANGILYVTADGAVRTYYQNGVALADTAVSQTITPGTAANGVNVTITLTATNNGPAAAGSVVVRDVLPSGLTYVSAVSSQGACSQSGGVVTCAVGNLANGASATVTITARSSGAGNLSNYASIVSAVYDAYGANNTSYASVNGTPPTVTTLATGAGATMRGTADANGVNTLVSFDCGPTATYGWNIIASPSVIGGTTTFSVSASSAGLSPNTAYHYRTNGLSAGGVSYGADMSFTTPNNVATLSGLALSAGTLSPAFASGTTSYSVAVDAATSSIALTPTASDSNATIRCEYLPVASGSASSPNTLFTGINYIYVQVIAQDGTTTVTYTLTVTRDDTVITTQSGTQTDAAGQPATFSVSATGTGPFTYQWYKDGNAIGGATDASYTIPSVSTGSAGNYWVVVTNVYGMTASNTYALTVPNGVPALPPWGWLALPALLLAIAGRWLPRSATGRQ